MVSTYKHNNPALSKIASLFLQTNLHTTNIASSRLQGVKHLMHLHRKVSDLVFFHRLWDVYELDIAIRNTMISPLSIDYHESMSVRERSELFRFAVRYDECRLAWKSYTDRIVCTTREEFEKFTFGDFLDSYLENDTCHDTVGCFALDMYNNNEMRSIQSRADGIDICDRYEDEDWNEEFGKAWDLYLLLNVRKRHDIWKSENHKHALFDDLPNAKRRKFTTQDNRGE